MFTGAQIDQWRSDIYELLDTPQPFADWLRSKGRQIVGRGYHVEDCPIHNFLADQAPWLDCWVGMCHIYCDLGADLCSRHGWPSPRHGWSGNSRIDYYGGYAKPVPDWVRDFILAFDRRFCLNVVACRLYDQQEEERRYNSYATGEEALGVLVEVVPDLVAVKRCAEAEV